MKTTMGIMAIVILVLGFFLLNQMSIINKQDNEISILKAETDTVYRRIVKVPKPYPVYQKPEKIVIYKDTGSTKYDILKLNNGRLVMFTNNLSDSIVMNKRFITSYPLSEKLISIDLTSDNLDIQLLSLNGFVKEKKYKLNLYDYKYRYVNNELSVKAHNKLKLVPEIVYSFRPRNSFHDLDVGLKLETNNFDYILGLNGFYYESVKLTGYDVKFSVRYNFK